MTPWEYIPIISHAVKIFKTLKDWFKSSKRKIDSTTIQVSNETTIVVQVSERIPETSGNLFHQRVCKMFEAHEIPVQMIPLFYNQCINASISWKPSEMSDAKSIIETLGQEGIYVCADLFGVNRSWLHGEDNIYDFRNFYKSTYKFIDLVFELKLKNEFDRIEGFAIRSKSGFNNKDEAHQRLFIILAEQVAVFNKKPIYRFIPITTDWNWGYWRTRFEAKSIFYLEDHRSDFIKFRGVEVKDENGGGLVINAPQGGKRALRTRLDGYTGEAKSGAIVARRRLAGTEGQKLH